MAFFNPDFSEYHHSYASSDYHSYASSDYDSAQFEPQITHSAYEPTFYNLLDYPPHDSGISFSANAFCKSTFSSPSVIEYDPNYHSGNFEKVSTQFVISYSVSEFNEPEFEEYDPTPYGGGYDIVQTYGKPLPPSNEICYPQSSSLAPKAKERIEEKTKPTQIDEDGSEAEEIRENKGVCEADLGSGYESGRVAEGDYDNGRAVTQFAGGYGLEAMDLCETLFGYWPCLSRVKKQTDGGNGNMREDCYGNQWETAADYLFGSYFPYPHEQTRDFGDVVYGYESRYRE